MTLATPFQLDRPVGRRKVLVSVWQRTVYLPDYTLRLKVLEVKSQRTAEVTLELSSAQMQRWFLGVRPPSKPTARAFQKLLSDLRLTQGPDGALTLVLRERR
jgi:hypothetical protein